MDNTENLREHVMINQFEMATGCTKEQSRQILQASRWEYLTALSMFFQDNNAVVVSAGGYNQQQQQNHKYPIINQLNTVCAPCNTPTTPPNFPDALLALQKLHTSDWSLPSANNNNIQQQHHPFSCTINCNNSPRQVNCGAAKVLSPFNPMPPLSIDKSQQQQAERDWSAFSINENGSSKLQRSGISIDSGENPQQSILDARR